MPSAPDLASIERRVRGALLRLHREAPFFAALSLFARFLPSEHVPTACTDGRDVFYNPAFLAGLDQAQLGAVLLHELLHAALAHPWRVGARDPVRWNVAADIVVNGIVAAQRKLSLPAGAVRNAKLEHLSVEEIYGLLDAHAAAAACPDCLQKPFGDLLELEGHWRRALLQAEAAARSAGQGTLPAGLERLVREASAPRVDWRTQLWRFLVRTPTDFGAFDRRFLHQRLYLEALEGESLRALICVDTSGSISGDVLGAFLAEVRGVLGAYPHVRAELYYADASLYGPYPIDADTPLPPPKGGGGTRFEPFFEQAEQAAGAGGGETLFLYLTDGFGSFPKSAPEAPVLWVVAPGGAVDTAFPFGTVVRLLDEGAPGAGGLTLRRHVGVPPTEVGGSKFPLKRLSKPAPRWGRAPFAHGSCDVGTQPQRGLGFDLRAWLTSCRTGGIYCPRLQSGVRKRLSRRRGARPRTRASSSAGSRAGSRARRTPARAER